MPKQVDLDTDLQQQLDALQGSGLLRSLAAGQGIDFASNDYLGLSGSPLLLDRWKQAVILLESFGARGSRLLRGNTELHEAVESELAAWRGSEAALLFGSGYDANTGIIAALADERDCILSDEANHASLIDGIRLSKARRLIFRHNDLNHLEELLRLARPARHLFIVLESLYSMDGDSPDFHSLFSLADKYEAELIVDEAHAGFALGPHGRGEIARQGVLQMPAISLFTCGKALGGSGAFVACSATMRKYLINTCRSFIFTTAPALPMTLWTRLAVQFQQDREDLRQALAANASCLRDCLEPLKTNLGAGTAHILPVQLGDEEYSMSAAASLRRRGFDVRAVRPPTVPSGTSRLRISLSAIHTESQLRSLASAITEVLSR